MFAPPSAAGSVVILSGAGLSAPSGVPTFRDAGGLWEGNRPEELATPGAWARNEALVRRFYDVRRQGTRAARPNAGHEALVRLQAAWGPQRVSLVTQNVDGLIQRAAAQMGLPVELVEMHGTNERLRCVDPRHPEVEAPVGDSVDQRCARCGAALRPAVVWFGETPIDMDQIVAAVVRAEVFIAVGTSGVVYPAAGYGQLAQRRGARTLEINPIPSGVDWFEAVIAQSADQALPDLVSAWLS